MRSIILTTQRYNWSMDIDILTHIHMACGAIKQNLVNPPSYMKIL